MSRETQRIDKWLWHARVAKTRSLAAALVSGGKVRVDGERVVKPAYAVKTGQTLTINLDQQIRILEITGFVERRGSAAVAATTFEDYSPQIERIREKPLGVPLAGPRPDKRTRRLSARITGKPQN